MAEIATIARPYAQALYGALQGAKDSKKTSGAPQWLKQLAAITSDSGLQQAAANPKLGNAQLFSLIVGLLPKALPDEGSNFLRTVLQNNRLLAVPEIVRQYEALHAAATGAAEATIYSAFPLEGAALDALLRKLEAHFKTRLNAHVVQDSSLIGGVRVVVGDEVLDSSIKARIEQMRNALTA